MNKKIIVIMTLCMALAILLCGCGESYNFGPVAGENYADKKVVGNGGMAVVQGDYLYFINGVSNYTDENVFGSVEKGTIMRYALENGKIKGDAQLIVPKKVFSSSANAGIYVYGEWIYYVTPSNVTDSEGVIQTDYIEFFRTKTDGTATQMIHRLKGNSTEYAFSRDALVYYADSTLYSVKIGSNEVKTISEDVTSYLFPRETDYDPAATSLDADEYVYYTKASENDTDTNNELWIASMNGDFNEKAVGKLSFLDDPSKFENPTTPEEYPDYSKIYTLTLKKYADGVLYYTKQYYQNGSAVDAGVYSYDVANEYLNKTEVGFDKSKEVIYSTSVYTTIYPYEAGKVLASDGSKLWLLGGAGVKSEVFPSNITVVAINSGYIFYTKSGSNDIYKFKLTADESAVKVTVSTPDSAWLKAEMIGNYIFYVQPDYDYVYAIDTTLAKDAEGYDVMLGKYSKADEDAIAKAEEE